MIIVHESQTGLVVSESEIHPAIMVEIEDRDTDRDVAFRSEPLAR